MFYFIKEKEFKDFLNNKNNNKNKELEFEFKSNDFFIKLKKINKVYILLILNN